MNRPTPTSSRSDWARAARRLSNKSFRDRVSRFLVEGPQAVRELVTWRPDDVAEVVLSDEATSAALAVAEQARSAGLEVTEVPEQVLVSITDTVTPQGVAAVATYLDQAIADLLADQSLGDRSSGDQSPLGRDSVLLHEVGDPGNAGTVLRTADAAGARSVFFGSGSVDPYNGKCVRASAGSLFHTGIGRNLESLAVIESAQAAGFTALATSLSGSIELGSPEAGELLDKRVLWVFGSEAHGLPDDIVAACDHAVRVPIAGSAESLNLASAAAVCLYARALSR